MLELSILIWYDIETGGSMLAITGSMNIWFIANVTDMRMGRHRLLDIVKDRFSNLYNGDMFAFMSQNRQLMKLVRYENRMYMLYGLDIRYSVTIFVFLRYGKRSENGY